MLGDARIPLPEAYGPGTTDKRVTIDEIERIVISMGAVSHTASRAPRAGKRPRRALGASSRWCSGEERAWRWRQLSTVRA